MAIYFEVFKIDLMEIKKEEEEEGGDFIIEKY